MSDFYTYFHTRNDTSAVFYVGKGVGRRAYATARGQHWRSIYKKHGRTVHFAMTHLSEEDAFEHERFLIACFRDIGCDLINQTDGGDGTSGFSHSNKTKTAISRSLCGHSVSQETRIALSKSIKGKKIHTSESKAKISKAQIGKKKPESMRRKLSESTKGRLRAHMTPEFMKRVQSLATQAVRGTRQAVVTCPHCGKSGGVASMTRWHMDNCPTNRKQDAERLLEKHKVKW